MPATKLSYTSAIGAGSISIESDDLPTFMQCLAELGLASVNGAPAEKEAPAPKPTKAAKTPAVAASQPTASAPAPAQPEKAASSESDTPATPAEAAAAIRGYGAKHGIEAAKALLTKLGFAKTSEITAEKAQSVIEAVAETEL